MPNTPEPRPAPADGRCPPRYATERQARRGAYWSATKRSEKPTPPERCADCNGGWHLATTTDTTATTTPTGD